MPLPHQVWLAPERLSSNGSHVPESKVPRHPFNSKANEAMLFAMKLALAPIRPFDLRIVYTQWVFPRILLFLLVFSSTTNARARKKRGVPCFLHHLQADSAVPVFSRCAACSWQVRC